MIAQFFRIFYLKNLVKGIFNNRVSKACCDILYRSTFFLSLLNFRVHKYGTTRTQVDWQGCQQTFLRELVDWNAQTGCECIDEGTTTRGACFVQYDIFDIAITDLTAFHILTADVQDKGNIRAEVTSCTIVSHCFYFTNIDAKGAFKERFAVTRYTRMRNISAFW